MKGETPQFELARLRKEQSRTRHDEVFGGLSAKERSSYDAKQHRIRDLERVLSEDDPLQELVLLGREDGPDKWAQENSREEDAGA